MLVEVSRLDARISRREHLEIAYLGRSALTAGTPLLLARFRTQVLVSFAVRTERPGVIWSRIVSRTDDHRLRLLRGSAWSEVDRLLRPLDLLLRAVALLAVIIRPERRLMLRAGGSGRGPSLRLVLARSWSDEKLLLHFGHRCTAGHEPHAVASRSFAILQTCRVVRIEAVIQASLRPAVVETPVRALPPLLGLHLQETGTTHLRLAPGRCLHLLRVAVLYVVRPHFKHPSAAGQRPITEFTVLLVVLARAIVEESIDLIHADALGRHAAHHPDARTTVLVAAKPRAALADLTLVCARRKLTTVHLAGGRRVAGPASTTVRLPRVIIAGHVALLSREVVAASCPVEGLVDLLHRADGCDAPILRNRRSDPLDAALLGSSRADSLRLYVARPLLQVADLGLPHALIVDLVVRLSAAVEVLNGHSRVGGDRHSTLDLGRALPDLLLSIRLLDAARVRGLSPIGAGLRPLEVSVLVELWRRRLLRLLLGVLLLRGLDLLRSNNASDGLRVVDDKIVDVVVVYNICLFRLNDSSRGLLNENIVAFFFLHFLLSRTLRRHGLRRLNGGSVTATILELV